MVVQDVRIVELIKRERSVGASQELPSAKNYLTITYYDKIRVYQATVAPGEDPLQAAYGVMEQIPSHSGERDCEFRQLIVGFADVEETNQEFQKFWEEQNCSLFFVTMVNVSLNVKLEDEIKRIQSVLDGVDYRLYLTYEYGEILIFAKSASLQAYAECVMKIGFHKENRGVLDTITMCCFGDGPAPQREENATVCIQLGVKDYQKAVDYLQRKGIDKKEIHWVLGRSDIGFLMVNSGLSWVWEFYREEQEKDFPWLSTTQFSVLVWQKDPEKSPNLTGEPVGTPWHAISKQRLKQICPLYEEKCRELHIHADPVFERILYETGRLVDSGLENRLSQDLAVCILPELDDFLQYLEHILTNPALQEMHAEMLRSSLNSFYLNVLALVNSTVHSNQEFVLIPHSAPPSFEMPPKVIVYYGLIVRQIIEVFRDEERIYGVMLAPKLVDDLEVESFSIAELEELGHLLSVNIGEKLLYNLRDTVMTLGHEMAHFVGEATRKRDCRRKLVLSFYLYRLLSRMCNFCLGLLPGGAELDKLVDGTRLYETAEKLSQSVVKCRPLDRPLKRKLMAEVKMLAGTVLHDPACTEIILQNVILPLFALPECRKYLAWHLSAVLESSDDGTADAYLCARTKRMFEQAVRDCLENWSASVDEKEFSEYIGYLFTEAYADLAMVMLFKMSMEEYIHIFGRDMAELEYHTDTAEDAIEMTRFIVVVRAAARTQKEKDWKKDWGGAAVNEGSLNWEDVLRDVAEAACKWDIDIFDFCQEHRIDVILANCLVKYLVECAGALDAHFHKVPQTVEVLQELHAEIRASSSALSRIVRIREQERKCLNRLVPPRKKPGSQELPAQPLIEDCQ